MPKLLIFAPCEKVIVAQNENTISLITLLQNITFVAAQSQEIPDQAFIPMKWYSFSMWQASAEEVGQRFEQQVELILPDGSSGLRQPTVFTFEAGKLTQRIINPMLGFPIYQTGACSLRLSMKSAQGWQEHAAFPISIIKSSPEAFLNPSA